VRIKLSEPILKFRPSVDVLNTLLHEYAPSLCGPRKHGAHCADISGGRMIHAYLFVAGGKHARGDDPSGHGFGFRKFLSSFLYCRTSD